MNPELLAPSIADIVSGLRRAELRTVSDLRAIVLGHLQAAESAAQTSPFVDLERATGVGQCCLALLNGWSELSEVERHWVQAGCVYFAEADDDEDDFESIVGFDDDAEVLNHIAAQLGRAELLISLD